MKEIKLTKSKVALVDDSDYEYLNQFKWYAREYNHTFYACRAMRIGKHKQKVVRMHRIILGLIDTDICDHKDHNGLNNQRNNLRVATSSDNAANRKGFGRSKYLGVTFYSTRKTKNPWIARVHRGDAKFHLGYFENESDAALAYNKKAYELFGEFANLNKI